MVHFGPFRSANRTLAIPDKRWFRNGGFEMVVRVWSGEQIPTPHFNLNFTSVLPLFYLFLTSCLPHLNPCCRKVYWTKKVQNGPNDHFGQNDLIPNRILAFDGPKWTKMVHFGPFRSANRTLAIPDKRWFRNGGSRLVRRADSHTPF